MRIDFILVAQDAITVMQRHGLEPQAYSMVCCVQRHYGTNQMYFYYAELQALLFAASMCANWAAAVGKSREQMVTMQQLQRI